LLLGLLDVDSQIDWLVLETVFPFDSLSSVFNAQSWPLRLVSSILVCTSFTSDAWVVSFVHLVPRVSFGFAGNVAEGLVGIRHLLVDRHISLHFIATSWSLSLCLLLGLSLLSLFCNSFLVVWTAEILALDSMHWRPWHLNLLRTAVLLALLCASLLIWTVFEGDSNLLADLDRSLGDSKSTIGLSSALVAEDVDGVFERPVSGRRRHFGLDVHGSHCLLQSIDLVKGFSGWRFFCGCFAYSSKVSSDGLGIAFDDHWFERRNFLLIFGLSDVCRGRSHAVLVLGTHILLHALELLLFTQISCHVALEDHLLESVWIDALLFIFAQDHVMGLSSNLATLILQPDFLNAVWVNLKLLMAKLVVSQVFVSRHYRIKVKDAFVGSFEVTEKIVGFS
jgi:hypothetical protein